MKSRYSMFCLLTVAFLIGYNSLTAAENERITVLYEFPNGSGATAPLYQGEESGYEATDAQWVLPGKEERLYGFGGKASNAYLNNSAAPRQFDPESYLTFTIKAEKGYTLRLSSLSFRFGASTLETYEGDAFTVFTRVFSDAQANDFSKELPLGPDKSGEMAFELTSVPQNEPTYSLVSADLNGEEFQERESVTFRVHLFCPERSSRIFLRLDDITIEGRAIKR